MSFLSRIRYSPVLIRVVPFVVFVALTSSQSFFGDAARFWIYLAKTVLGGWMLWAIRPYIQEMRWTVSGAALLVGVAVFLLWIGLSPCLQALGLNPSFAELKISGKPWNPHAQFGEASAWAWFFVVARLLGSSLVVPPLEEVFFRSFVYRYLIQNDFEKVSLGQFRWVAFLATSGMFALEHREWLAGLLCGFAFQGLVCWKGRLGDAIVAHAVTNFLLGLWVIRQDAWNFW